MTSPGGDRAIQTTQSRGRTVLVVDDDPGVVRFVAFVLRRNGFQVLEADGAAEALDIARRHNSPIDLLLTDVVMPEVDGPSLWRSLNRLRPEAKVLFMSGHPGNESGLGSPFLRKPFVIHGLLQEIEQAFFR